MQKSLTYINLLWSHNKGESSYNKTDWIELHCLLWKLSQWMYNLFCQATKQKQISCLILIAIKKKISGIKQLKVQFKLV